MRKPDESIIINNNIELKVIEIKGKSVKLGFEFPKGASVLRKELYDKIMAENLAAAAEGTGTEDMNHLSSKLALKKKSEDDTNSQI
jgi:carbon storage regulator